MEAPIKNGVRDNSFTEIPKYAIHNEMAPAQNNTFPMSRYIK